MSPTEVCLFHAMLFQNQLQTTMLVSRYILFPLQGSGPYLLTVGQDFAGLFEAALAALRIRLPLASLYIHV